MDLVPVGVLSAFQYFSARMWRSTKGQDEAETIYWFEAEEDYPGLQQSIATSGSYTRLSSVDWKLSL